MGYQLPTAQSAVEYVAQSGPLTRFWNPDSAPWIPMSVDPSLNDQCEKAPCTRLSDATGLCSGLAMPASENATSRAPKLCPMRWTRTVGAAVCSATRKDARPLRPMSPARPFI